MGLGFLAVGILGSCLSWGLIILFGRRTIYNAGLALLAALQFLIGILDFAPNKANRPGIVWAQASILIAWNFFYNLTIGPVGFSILCETSAMHLREKTIAFATAVQAAVGIGMTVAVPYMINPDQAALGGKMGFFFGGLAALSCIWAYFRIPETVCAICITSPCPLSPLFPGRQKRFATSNTDRTMQKNRTYEELDIMFNRGVRARDFKHYKNF
jgi:SP family general alpha glucoside:H+ symporter-like MFS transporter